MVSPPTTVLLVKLPRAKPKRSFAYTRASSFTRQETPALVWFSPLQRTLSVSVRERSSVSE